MTQEAETRAARWRGEPLLHFVVAGLVIVGLGRVAPGRPGVIPVRPNAADRQIVWTQADVDRVRQSGTARLRRPPEPAQMQALIADALRTEILAREAVRLGLDRDDPIIRARLAEKMDALAETALPEPTPDILRAWVRERPVPYMARSEIDFDQLSFSGGEAEARARAATAAPDPAGDPGDLRFDYTGFTPQEVLPLFGAAFVAALFQMEPAEAWQGPLRSDAGWHLVRIHAVRRAPTLGAAEILTAARDDWTDYQRVEARRRYYAELRQKFEVVLPAGAAP